LNYFSFFNTEKLYEREPYRNIKLEHFLKKLIIQHIVQRFKRFKEKHKNSQKTALITVNCRRCFKKYAFTHETIQFYVTLCAIGKISLKNAKSFTQCKEPLSQRSIGRREKYFSPIFII
jgi:hypothetical protein